MKKIVSICALVGAVCAASPALAADLGGPRLPADMFAAPAGGKSGKSVNWTGVYIGGQAGYGTATHDMTADASQSYTIPGHEAHCTNGGRLEQPKTVGQQSDVKTCVPGDSEWIEPECAADWTGGHDGWCHSGGETVPPVSGGRCTNGGTPNGNGTCTAAATSEWVEATATRVVTKTASAFLDGVGSNGFFGGGTVGADLQSGHWVVGVFGDYNFSGVESSTGVSFNDTEVVSAKIDEGNSWLVAARAGYLFGAEKRALLYGLFGYGQTEVDYSLTIGGNTGKKETTFSGIVIGAGGEYALSQNIFFGIEYQHFFGSEETLYDGSCGVGCNVILTDDMDTDKVMARLKLKLGRK